MRIKNIINKLIMAVMIGNHNKIGIGIVMRRIGVIMIELEEIKVKLITFKHLMTTRLDLNLHLQITAWK
jgi:hypothetical protein